MPEDTKDPRTVSDNEPSAPAADPLILVPDGDLLLTVGVTGKRRFLVASQILWAASHYFRASFGPGSQYSLSEAVRNAAALGKPAELELDDNPTAMEIVLYILCLRHKQLPHEMNFAEVVELAVLADKYELEIVIRPWVTKWLEPYKDNVEKYEDFLFVSWVFGYDAIFSACTKRLTTKSCEEIRQLKRMPDPVIGDFVSRGVLARHLLRIPSREAAVPEGLARQEAPGLRQGAYRQAYCLSVQVGQRLQGTRLSKLQQYNCYYHLRKGWLRCFAAGASSQCGINPHAEERCNVGYGFPTTCGQDLLHSATDVPCLYGLRLMRTQTCNGFDIYLGRPSLA
jgi:hypothetical protein